MKQRDTKYEVPKKLAVNGDLQEGYAKGVRVHLFHSPYTTKCQYEP